MKKLLKSDGMKAFIGWVAAGYIWFVYRTSRWQVLNGEFPDQMVKDKKPFIMSFWHGRILMMPICVKGGVKAHVMISRHGDGEIISRAIEHWGLKSVRGSSSKGALGAVKDILKIIRKNEVAVITPDGPRGPRMRAQDGIARIASMTGVPVLPSAFSTTRGRRLESWDSFMLAKPFSRGVIIWGDPIYVPKKLDEAGLENAKLEIERSLNFVTQEADRLCGHDPVQPGDIPSDLNAADGHEV